MIKIFGICIVLVSFSFILEAQSFRFISNSSWKSAATANSGWTNPDYDDSGWDAAIEETGIPWSTESNDFHNFGSDARLIWSATSAQGYLRKTFILPGKAITGELWFCIDDNIDLYVNGNLLIADNTLSITSGNFNIQPYLAAGKNSVAARVSDVIDVYHWFCCEIKITAKSDSLENSTRISIYPNPTIKSLNIKNAGSEAQILIFDILGKLITETENADNKVDVSYLAMGTYVIQIKDKDQTFRSKFVKQ